MPEFKRYVSPPGESTYHKSRRMRADTRKLHKLGFRRPPKVKRSKGVSIVSVRVCDLRDDEYELLLKKLELLPQNKRVFPRRDWTQKIKDVIGEDLASEIIKVSPDQDKINYLCNPIPDIEKRLGRNGDD